MPIRFSIERYNQPSIGYRIDDRFQVSGFGRDPTPSLVDRIVRAFMFGIISVFKPVGLTSRDCVNRIQRSVRPFKVGHAGTLDPIAEGVLIVAVGQATRLIELLHELPKVYRGTFRMGCTSESADTETEVTSLADAPIVSQEMLVCQIPKFVGTIQQRPPAYSAVKIDGKRAYDLARKGQNVAMPERSVTIHRIDLLSCSPSEICLDVSCESGTYIRSLGRDLALACQSDAVMTHLLRSSVGPFTSELAWTLESLESREAITRALVNPAECLLRDRVRLSEDECRRMRNGLYLELTQDRIEHNSAKKPRSSNQEAQDCILGLDPSNRLRGILTQRSPTHWGAALNFDHEDRSE